ncbi:MAG TPA: amidase [Terriglobales bacterium]|nr:amidase [Terriglobales bacterium]
MQSSILEIAEKLKKRAVSPVELTRDCLARTEKLNSTLNAFITITADSAMSQARQAEDEIQHGRWRGPLHGIPLALKDIIDTAGVRTTAASALFKDRIPREDAEVVRRLKDAGAVLLGKQNLHEFAYGGSSMVSYYGEVHNPWDPSCIAGGSSGGSAAAVAAGLCYGAIATDTAGSIREPAALCGVVGLKPTYGRVSTRGVIPLSWSLDHVGPIAATVSDAGVILQAIAGFDAGDINSEDVPVAGYVAGLGSRPKTLRIGVPRAYFFESLDPEIESAVNQALSVLTTLGADIRDIELEAPTDRTVQSAESYAYHAEHVARTPELYQAETLRRIRTGADVSATDYIHRRRELERARREIGKVFESIDVFITPTTPVLPPTIAELKENPERLRPTEILLLRNTRPVNVWGLPAISVPCGFSRGGLPIGLQIVGPHWGEALILEIAHSYEQATDWHKRGPMLRVE